MLGSFAPLVVWGARLGSVAVLGSIVAYAVSRRDHPSALPFGLLAGAFTVWALARLIAPPLPEGSLVESVLSFIGVLSVLTIPIGWVAYTLTYTGRQDVLTWPRMMALLALGPGLMGASLYVFGLRADPMEMPILSTILFEGLLVGALLFIGTYVLLKRYRSHPSVSAVQLTGLFAGVLAPFVVPNITGSGLIGLQRGNTAVGLLVGGAVLAATLHRYPLLTALPTTNPVTRETLVEQLQEAVFVLDWNDRIVDMNAAASTLVSVDRQAVLGQQAQTVFDAVPASATAYETVEQQTPEGMRRYRISRSPIGSGDPPAGAALVFRDVTQRETREQQLEILTRVLRHNLRNRLDVILGQTERITSEEPRKRIQAAVEDLRELGAQARDAEEILDAYTEQPTNSDVMAVVTTVVETMDHRYPDSDLRVTGPDTAGVATHTTMLERALVEVLENAIEHTDRTTPTVEVTVETQTGTGGVQIHIADEGPGLPDREREILASGEETPLKHGQGIGLWIAKWAIDGIGGTITFEDNEPRGTIVIITVPDIPS
ncbi:MAG: ATP-binding protein [Salinarchaeum sp.]